MLIKQIKARRQFKAIVRLVIANREWLVPSMPPGMDSIIGLKRSVHVLARTKILKSLLKLTDIAILNKPSTDRTEEEKLVLYKLIGGLKCFRKYPDDVKMMLAARTYFAYYGPNRTIVRQNHKAQALYFIISGEVSVNVESYDQLLNENVSTITGTITAGNAFGEVSLLTDVPRGATIISMTAVELLFLKREDFNVVLKDSVRKKWDYIQRALRQFSYFDSWDDVTVTECCIVAKVTNFEKGQTIVGDGEGLKNWVHLVLRGECQVIEHLLLEPEYLHGIKKYKLYQGNKTEANRRGQITIRRSSDVSSLSEFSQEDKVSQTTCLPLLVETYFMQVCTYTAKACFGIGENMERRRVVALTDVECLLIPRYWLLLQGQSNIWQRILHYLQAHIPSTEEIFKEFIVQKQWRKYKEEFVRRQIHRVPCNGPQNVPYSIRIEEDFNYVED